VKTIIIFLSTFSLCALISSFIPLGEKESNDLVEHKVNSNLCERVNVNTKIDTHINEYENLEIVLENISNDKTKFVSSIEIMDDRNNVLNENIKLNTSVLSKGSDQLLAELDLNFLNQDGYYRIAIQIAYGASKNTASGEQHDIFVRYQKGQIYIINSEEWHLNSDVNKSIER